MMELWIVGGLGLIALGVLIFSIIKAKVRKNKKWFVLTKFLAIYIVACLCFFGLTLLIER